MKLHPVMVHWGDDHEWNLQALCLACALARSDATSVVLVKMVYVQQVGWLATPMQPQRLTDKEEAQCKAYDEIAEEYGVTLELMYFQYVTLAEAIVQAAEYINASAVFAMLSQDIFPLWRKILNWNIYRQLNALDCEFYNLEEGKNTTNWTPAVLIPTPRK